MPHLCDTLNLRDAHLLQAYLEAEGIPVEVQGGLEHAVRGELPWWPGLAPALLIPDPADRQRALALVQAFRDRQEPGPAGPPWTCPACGETHEPQFADCWSCGGARPGAPSDGPGAP
jgi:hypothetical protein